MVRALHIMTTLDVGGAEAQVLAVLTGLARPPNEISVAWHKGRGELAPRFRAAGIRAFPLDMADSLDPGANIICGARVDEAQEGLIRVMAVITGISPRGRERVQIEDFDDVVVRIER